MKKNLLIIAALLGYACYPLVGYSETPEEYKVKDANLSYEAAGLNLKQIELALGEYREFTESILTDEFYNQLKENKQRVTLSIKEDDLKKLSSLKWSAQNIGFKNWVIIVRGTLLKSAYMAKKYEYELAKCQKDVAGKDLVVMEKAMKEALAEYQNYLSKTVLVD